MATPIRDKYGTYHCRVGIPEELRHIIGKRELKRSLRTKDQTEARRLFGPVHAEFTRTIENARRQSRGERLLSSHDLEVLADRWQDKAIGEIERTGNYRDWFNWDSDADPETGEAMVFHWSPLVERLNEEAETKDTREMASVARELLGDELDALLVECGVPLPPNSEEYQILALRVAERASVVVRHAAEREQGRYSEPSQSKAQNPLSTERRPRGMTITGVWDAYAAKLAREEDEKTARDRTNDYRASVMELAEYLGNPPINEVTPDQLRQYRDFLFSLPSRPPKAVKELPILQRPGKVMELNLKTVSGATVRNRMIHCSALFSAATDIPGSGLESNPMESVRLPSRQGKKAKGERPDFTAEELASVFGGDWFTERAYPLRDKHGMAGIWLPLVLYYTGARREEIAGMNARDVRQIQGQWVFDICPDGKDRTVKNEQSIRAVPVHPDLLELGFLDYVASLPEGGSLWPSLRESKSEGRGYIWSRHFRQYLNSVGVREGVSPAHGLRHAFTTQLRESGVSDGLLSKLLGHANTSQTNEYGSYTIGTLLDGLKSLPSVPHFEQVRELVSQIATVDQTTE